MSDALQEGLRRAANKATASRSETPRKSDKPTKGDKPSRVGRVLIGGHFDPSVRKRMLMIRAQLPNNPTMQALLEEALDLLFERDKQPRMR